MRLFCILLYLVSGALFAKAQSGFVRSAGQPIPGASVTASQGAASFGSVTDADGHYGFPPLNAGLWTVTVEIFGFAPFKQEVDYAAAKGAVNFDVQLQESPFAQRIRQWAKRAGAAGGASNSAAAHSGTSVAAQDALAAEMQAPVASTANNGSSNESFLVSGSLSPGITPGSQADSGPELRAGGPGQDPFGGAGSAGNAPGFGSGGGFGRGGGAFGGGGFGGRASRGQARGGGAQFGNRRRRNEEIHGQASFTLTNSAVNAKPFSINGLNIPQAAYAQSRFSLVVGGPLVIKKLVKDPKTQFFFTYFGTRARNPELFTETVPTAAFRNGDFSQATQSLGTSATSVPVVVLNPATHLPFPNNTIPQNLLSATSLALLKFYPLPNEQGNANNYQYETAQANNANNLGARVQREITRLDRLSLNFQYQNRNGTTAQPFGYFDDTNGYGLNAQVQWTRNLSPTALSNLQFRFNRNRTEITPYFSSLPDVATALGIQGTSTNPLDFGPPTLNFTNFVALSDSVATLNRNQSQGINESVTLVRGKHSITLGGGYLRSDLSARTDPNGRGTLNFTGLATSQLDAAGRPVTGTGYDLADFLLGVPQSSSIQYSGFNEYFFQNQANGFAQDEWKPRANLTVSAGVWYEYFSPFQEKYGRLANLDIGPGFSRVYAVTAGGTGPYTGIFGRGLIDPDRNNWSPRVALAWKLPWFTRSTLFRSGYGIYYNGQAYNQFASLLAYQPPFAVSRSANASASLPLTIQNAFVSSLPNLVTNSFAVSRYYRTPYAGTWNASLQHEFGGGFFGEIGYLATKGTRLDVRTLPNQVPPGSSQSTWESNQAGNASGFTFDQSVGNSILNSLQLRVMRRFNRGISFSAYYQFAKSIDDSSTFGGAGNTVAQNWLDIAAERGLSSFDVRHQFSGNFNWTSPVAGPGSHIAPESTVGRLLKDWQLTGQITAQTGNPLTARVLGNSQQLAQTGGVGKGRADATGEPIETDDGFFNLDAFSVPPSGVYGNAGRNTIPGPGLFNLNVAFARSFSLSERRRVEFRVESNNVFNHVNYTNLYTVVNAVNYGLPSAAASMRTLDAVVRFRF